MARVKRGKTTRARHKKVLKLTKGYRGRRRTVYKLAKQAAIRAGQNAYKGRKLKKRYFRSLWIVRLNAACREHGIKYSSLISALKNNNLNLNRKVLSELAVKQPEEFKKIVEKIKSSQT